MQLSQHTLDVLKNFSTINDNFYSSGGSTIKTKNLTNNMMAQMEVAEDLPVFGIYKLSEFLGVVSLFDSPEFDFHEEYVIISSGKSKVKYRFADAQILDFPSKSPKFTTSDVSFNLSKEEMQSLIKASAVLGATRIIVRGDGTVAVKEPTSTDNEYSVEVDGLSGDFEIVFDIQFVKKMLVTDYRINITAKTLVCLWENKEQGIEYFIGADKTSKFNSSED
jgi:hypothetical protein